MKYIYILLGCIILSFSLYANKIDTQIEAIQKASESERFKLMNAFKREIIQMNETQRIEALDKLQAINNNKHAESTLKELTRQHAHRYSKYEEEITDGNKEANTDDNTATQTENNIESHTSNETQNSVETQTGNEVENNVETQTDNEVENSVETHIENQTQEHIEDETSERNEEEHDND